MPNPYEDARIESRDILGRLTEIELRQINISLNEFLDRIARAIRSERSAGLVAVQRIVQREANLLASEIERAVEIGRTTAFREILPIWRAAGIEYARSLGISEEQLSLIRVPPITMLGAFESLSPAGTWKTLIDRYSMEVAKEANSIIRNAIIGQVGPDELSMRLRKYVFGSEGFQDLFTEIPTITGDVFTIDLSLIPASDRGAMGEMLYNSERIGFSELKNARAEAEIQHYIEDPFVESVEWTLSPKHISEGVDDECDILATGDFFDLGPGIYPVNNVPSPPHPFDQCETLPITRDLSEIDQPKPAPDLVTSPTDLEEAFPRFEGSDADLQSAREAAAQAIDNAAIPKQT